jgi:hypothetical protein
VLRFAKEKTMNSISSVIESAKLANNGRLNSLAMTPGAIRCAEKAVARGLMTKHFASFPGFGMVALYEIA